MYNFKFQVKYWIDKEDDGELFILSTDELIDDFCTGLLKFTSTYRTIYIH